MNDEAMDRVRRSVNRLVAGRVEATPFEGVPATRRGGPRPCDGETADTAEEAARE